MPITFFKNVKGQFQNLTSQSGIGDQSGWWNSIAGGDFDNDGDIDYVVGNLGKNSFFRADDKHPVSIYAKDFDKNSRIDPIVTIYLKDQKGVKDEYTSANRDEIISQLPGVRKKYLKYKEFAQANIHHIFSEEEMKDALILRANNFNNCYLQNNGNGKFSLQPLPSQAQMAPINGMVVDDFNGDGNLDIAVSGNDYGNEVTNGRYDGMNGLVLLGDGAGKFTPQTILQAGLFIPGDAKALVKMKGPGNTYLMAASQNRGPLKIFTHKNSSQKIFPLIQTDKKAFLTLANGKKRTEEFYFGNSCLSQSGRFLSVDKNVVSVEIEDTKGKTRHINLQ
jgi:hypothetical protein